MCSSDLKAGALARPSRSAFNAPFRGRAQAAPASRAEIDAAVAAWLAQRVPGQAELGLHICSIWHHDTGAGQDNQVLVDAANAILSRVERPVNYLHIPVIPEHVQSDYEVLRSLKLGSGTRLYLGLINLADGLDGARRRIAMAEKVVPEFGVAMFCEIGRAHV